MKCWDYHQGELRPDHELFESLGWHHRPRSCVALIGAGGKTSLSLYLGEGFAALGRKVLFSTTTHLGDRPDAVTDAAAAAEAARPGRLVIAAARSSDGKLRSFAEEERALLSRRFDLSLFEADGSRCLPCKFPAAHEPLLPRELTDIILVMGLSAAYKRLVDGCHRAELAQKYLGLDGEAILDAATAARILWRGYLRNRAYPQKPLLLFLNQADDEERRIFGVAVARELERLAAGAGQDLREKNISIRLSCFAEAERAERHAASAFPTF